MILAIVGSRQLEEVEHAAASYLVNSIISAEFSLHESNLVVISGGATGVDSLAEEYAGFYLDFGLRFEAILPKVRRWEGPGGFKERNIEIIERSNFLVCIQSRSSETYGSGWTYEEAKRREKEAVRFWV